MRYVIEACKSRTPCFFVSIPTIKPVQSGLYLMMSLVRFNCGLQYIFYIGLYCGFEFSDQNIFIRYDIAIHFLKHFNCGIIKLSFNDHSNQHYKFLCKEMHC